MANMETRLVCEPYIEVRPYKIWEEAGSEVVQVMVMPVVPTGVVEMPDIVGIWMFGVPPPPPPPPPPPEVPAPELPPPGGVEEIGTEHEAVVPPLDPVQDQRLLEELVEMFETVPAVH